MTRSTPALFGALSLLLTACGPSTFHSPQAVPANRSATAGGGPASQGTFGLRVSPTRDPNGGPAVHVVAVVTDLDGHQEISEVGDYPGRLISETHIPEDATHEAEESATIEDAAARRVIWMVRDGDTIEVRRRNSPALDADYEVIDRIPVPGGAARPPER